MGKRKSRPLAVTLTAGGVFLLGAGNLVQSGQVLFRYDLFRSLPLSVPAWYPALGGAVWGAVWIVLGAGLWRGREWARRSALIAIPLQLGFWIADWALFSRSTIAIQSFAFDFFLRLLIAGLAAGVLLFGGRREERRGGPDAQPEIGQSHVD